MNQNLAKDNPVPKSLHLFSSSKSKPSPVIIGGKKLYEAGKYEEAYPILKSDLQQLINTEGSIPEIAKSQNQLGLCCWKLKKYEEAIESFKLSLANWRKTEDVQKIVSILSNIGYVYNDLKNYNVSVKFFEEGYKILKTIPGIQDQKYFTDVVANTIFAYNKLENYEKTIEYFPIILDYLKAKGSRNEYGQGLNKLSGILMNLGRYDEAADFLNKASEVLKEENGVHLARTLHYQASVFKQQKKIPKAFNKSLEALEIRKKHPENISKLINAYNGLGLYSQDLGKYEDAIMYHEEALKLCLQLNTEDIVVANSHLYLGGSLRALNRLDEASIYLEKSFQIRRKIMGDDHRHTKANLKWITDLKISVSDSKNIINNEEKQEWAKIFTDEIRAQFEESKVQELDLKSESEIIADANAQFEDIKADDINPKFLLKEIKIGGVIVKNEENPQHISFLIKTEVNSEESKIEPDNKVNHDEINQEKLDLNK